MLRFHPRHVSMPRPFSLPSVDVSLCVSVCLCCLFQRCLLPIFFVVCFRPVPSLAALKGCNSFLQKASSMPALTSTVGRLGGEMMVKQVGDMARGSSGASEVEKGYLEAPYTQVIYL